LGFESASIEHQKNLSDSKINNELFLQAVSNLRQAGYKSEQIGAYIFIGLPGQSVEEVIETMDFVHRIANVKIYFSQYSPVPGTKEFERAVKEYNFDPTDPLLANKTAFPLQSKDFTFQMYEKIRQVGKFLNTRLSSPLDVKYLVRTLKNEN
jgi:radical SAM superfamily enzyme YgiQ (UPF0313 family)